MAGRLEGKTCVVVGAGQTPGETIGNGRAMAVLFAREGAQVACIDVNKEAADNTVAQITSEGGKAFADIVDVSDVTAIAPAVERCSCSACLSSASRPLRVRPDVRRPWAGPGASPGSRPATP